MINGKGDFYSQVSSDKNFDPQYTKVPEISDTKKSFNIGASNAYKIQKQA